MSPELSDVIERRFKVSGGAILSVENPAGETHVHGAAGDEVVVRARKRAYSESTEGGKRVLENLEVQMEQVGNKISIWQRAYMLERGWMNLFRERRATVDYVIDVPRGSQVNVRSASGEIEVRGVEGALELQSVSGDVAVDDVRGALRLKTVSGDIAATRCAGSTDVNTVSGDLVFRSCSWPSCHVRAISGDINAEALMNGRIDVNTISGDVQLATPSPFTLNFDTTSGDLHANGVSVEKVSRRSYVAQFGRGGADISVHTVSGDLAVQHADVDAPEAPATAPVVAEAPSAMDRKAEALEILKALESGSIDAEEAARRLDRARG